MARFGAGPGCTTKRLPCATMPMRNRATLLLLAALLHGTVGKSVIDDLGEALGEAPEPVSILAPSVHEKHPSASMGDAYAHHVTRRELEKSIGPEAIVEPSPSPEPSPSSEAPGAPPPAAPPSPSSPSPSGCWMGSGVREGSRQPTHEHREAPCACELRDRGARARVASRRRATATHSRATLLYL